MEKYKHTIPITAIVENNGEFLFIRRSRNSRNMAGKWVFPGGKIEVGEDAIQALYRELKEETGLNLSNQVAFLSSYRFIREEDASSSVGFVFIVKSNNRDVKKDKSIEEYKWIKPEEIADYDFSYKSIKDFNVENKVTIPGMEVHVRNAIIALKKNAFVDYRLLSVTGYQDRKCSINKKYLIDLQKCDQIEEFFTEENIFPKLNKGEENE